MFAGMMARPRATSSLTNSGLQCPNDSLGNININGYIGPCYLFSNVRDWYKKESPEFINYYKEKIEELNLNKNDIDKALTSNLFEYILSNKHKLNCCNRVCRCDIRELFNFI